jgi:hypothetical protein
MKSPANTFVTMKTINQPFFASDFLRQTPQQNRAFIDFCERMGWCHRPQERNWLESVIRPTISPEAQPHAGNQQAERGQPGDLHGPETQPA